MHVSLDCLLCVPPWGPSDALWTTTDFHFVKTAAREFVAVKMQIFRSGRGPRSEESKRPLSSLGGNPPSLVTDSGRFLQLSTRDKRVICCGSPTPWGPKTEPAGAPSHRLLMIIAQKPTQSLAARHRPL